ncbi:MAG: hypothetical protein WDN29_08440 [Methylovirgula sp.]
MRITSEFAIEFGEHRPMRREEQFGASGETSAELCGIGAPLTMKLVPGSDSNAVLSDGLLTKSCAQASFPRSARGILSSDVTSSKREPISVRTSLALIAL